MKKHLFRPKFAALMSVAALTLTACGSAKSASMDYVTETAAAYNMAAKAGGANRMADTAPGAAPGSMETVSGEGLTSSSGSMETLPASRKLIRNASLEVETDKFDTLLATVTSQVSGMGGYVENSSISGNARISSGYSGGPQQRYASITARIPQDKLDSFITAVEQNGNVTHKSESISDVTLQYSDIESRKKSLTMEQDRIWALLEKADSLDAVIALEKRLSEIRYELESMESQLRLYDNQVDYSTVTLNISEVTTFTPTSPESFVTRIQKGFTKNGKAMGQFLTNFIIGLITTVPVWLPIALIAGLALFIFRRHGKHKNTTTAKSKRAEKAETETTKAEAAKENPPTL